MTSTTPKETLLDLLRAVIGALPGAETLTPDDLAAALVLEFPDRTEHGHVACTAALRLARPLRQNPGDLARKLGEILAASNHPGAVLVERSEVAGPGFLNIFLAPAFFHEVLQQAHRERAEYGRSSIGGGLAVNLEFCSSNPTGPLTVAHGRQAAVGDALANLLQFAGYCPSREYYLNDCGNQVTVLARSVLARYAQVLGREAPFPEEGYRGEYIVDLARQFAELHGPKYLDAPEGEALEAARSFALEKMVGVIRDDLEKFGVRYDTWFSEGAFRASGAVERVLERLTAAGLTEERDGALWLLTTRLGDSQDRVLVKSDGSYTYRTPDIAYHENKFQRGFKMLVDIFGPDHHQEAQEVAMALRALGHDASAIRVLIAQYCTLYRGKEKLKMSTRAGQFITLRELIDEVGRDAARFFFLNLRTSSHLNFDLELAKKHSLDNPVYYIQYVSARIASVLRKAQCETALPPQEFRDGLFSPDCVDLAPLEARDLELASWIFRFPHIIERAALSLEVHRLCNFMQSFAEQFHTWYTECRVISDDVPLMRARLYLLSAARIVLWNGLRILGVAAPERM